MNLKYVDPMLPEGRKTILSKGGGCHRLPLVAPMPVQGSFGGPDIVVISGFGVCQMEICPKWDSDNACCSEAHPSHALRVRQAKADAEAATAVVVEGDEPPRIVTP